MAELVSSPLGNSAYVSRKVSSSVRDEEEKAKLRRRRGAVMLVLDFLLSCGYTSAAAALQQESSMSLSKYCLADNVTLMMILTQHEEHARATFGTTPKYYRSLDPSEVVLNNASQYQNPTPQLFPRNGKNSTNNLSGLGSVQVKAGPNGTSVPKPLTQQASSPSSPHSGSVSRTDPLSVDGVKFVAGLKPRDNWGTRRVVDTTSAQSTQDLQESISIAKQLLPPPKFPTDELTELSNIIQRDIIEQNPSVQWADIIELEEAKQLLKEAVVYPARYPEFFQGPMRPWRGVLLFGPPGTGKTMLARAVATECRTTFFNISASTIVSKWRGDSEKLVRMLFDLARYYQPSTIFFDEIDSVMSQRSSASTEHEGSRRMKTELLLQMDGLCRNANEKSQVFVLAASNLPWDLDAALLRRLEKRIYVRLPSCVAREAMFLRVLYPTYDAKKSIDYAFLARCTSEYSGADVEIVCREALMRKVRTIIGRIEQEKSTNSESMETSQPLVQKLQVCHVDVLEALRCTQPASRGVALSMYETWEQNFGSGMTMEGHGAHLPEGGKEHTRQTVKDTALQLSNSLD